MLDFTGIDLHVAEALPRAQAWRWGFDDWVGVRSHRWRSAAEQG
ncbi:hypothetical protein [Bordetella genomosp. 5]|nr:hypothetical protein [Bordetella genomosp. 5]